MERLIYVPIERLEERYSAQWDDWFTSAFRREKIEFIRVGDYANRTIKHGQFLDVIETNVYKAKQLQQILDWIAFDVETPTTIFFTDLWFPGIQALFYVRDGMKLPIKIKGMLHAGTYDQHDFLTKSGMRNWGMDFERSFLKGVDTVYMATEFHKTLLEKYQLPIDKCEMVEWPVETEFRKEAKQNIVVFPHRIAPEKQPEVFDEIHDRYVKKYGHDAVWVKTKDVCHSKNEYYEVLATAKVAVSCALQETYGIAMVEAVNNGCIPVAPKRLSYPEVLCDFPLYDTLDQAVDMIYHALNNYKRPSKIEGKDIKWISKILS